MFLLIEELWGKCRLVLFVRVLWGLIKKIVKKFRKIKLFYKCKKNLFK